MLYMGCEHMVSRLSRWMSLRYEEREPCGSWQRMLNHQRPSSPTVWFANKQTNRFIFQPRLRRLYHYAASALFRERLFEGARGRTVQ